MRGFHKARQFSRVLTRRSTTPDSLIRVEASLLWRSNPTSTISSGIIDEKCRIFQSRYCKSRVQFGPCIGTQIRLFSSEASVPEENVPQSTPTDAVREIYDKILKSILEMRSAPPNAWLWSMVAECASHEHITLLFDVLQKLRIFRLSNLRIHDNFNSALCLEVMKACVRVGSVDYGKRALWKHNLYGLTPSIGSAHQLLLYAKQNSDVRLMKDVMDLVKKNDLPLQSGTADIVFSICYQTNKWDLMCKYGTRFVKAGVKLRLTSIGLWMDFSAKTGDVLSLWKVEKLRSESNRQHTLVSGLACAKGYLLEQQPENAAAIVELLTQSLPDERTQIASHLEKLVTEWPSEVIEQQKTDKREALAVSLQNNIPAMIARLASVGVKVKSHLGDLTEKAAVLS